MGRPYDQDMMDLIIKRYREGLSAPIISTRTGVPAHTVRNIIQKYNKRQNEQVNGPAGVEPCPPVDDTSGQ